MQPSSTIDLTLFPNELLSAILFHVYPNDLIAVASANRFLRDAVPQCIDHALAWIHVAEANDRFGSPDYAIHGVESIRYDHPLLFKHMVAAFASFGFSKSVVGYIWGKNWKPRAKSTPREETIRLNRVRAIREGLVRRVWLTDTGSDSEPDEDGEEVDEVGILADAAEMAGFMRSMELLDDLRRSFPEIITHDPDSTAFKRFLSASAASGFVHGLELIPAKHPILENSFVAAGDTGSPMSLLGLACESRHAPAVELLLEKGAPVDPKPYYNPSQRPLVRALYDDSLDILRLLLRHGPDLNNRHRTETPLHYASHLNNFEAVKLPLETGADIEACNFEGMTPLCSAARHGRVESVRLLLDAGANVYADGHCKRTTVVALACEDVELNRSKRGEQAVREHDDVVKMLIEAGAEVNTLNRDKDTALHFAVKNARLGSRSALLLLDAGADPTVKNRRGYTPLMRLFPIGSGWNEGLEELLDRLIEKGADLQERDSKGTAWQKLEAAAQNNPGLMQWMLRRKSSG
ncbi:hypothetical protein HDU96_002174 [Phlyctochytrium bullatum]|nr:hypothetical protein HDU96_002174 [Phlyctochytrium bullatum]